MKLKTLVLTVFLGSASLAYAASPNLATNGSFENPNISVDKTLEYAAGSTGIGGWTVLNGSVQLVRDSYLADLNYSLTASEGHQWIDLTGMTEGYGKGIVSNSFSVVSGMTYRLSFDVGTLAGVPTASVAFSINGGAAQTATNVGANSSGMKWTTHSALWVADGSSAQLTFLGSSANAGNNSLIGLDNVSFAAVVPEPETYAMMMAGLGLLGALARRKTKLNA